MLLEFKMKNFKSFRNLVEFKMTPAQKIKDLEYSLLKEKANNKEEKALSSSVIYGPNSSGKTNLIGGLQVFKAIVLRGNIKDADDLTSINIATEKLDFIPHIDSKENEPTYFYIKFLTNNMIIEYSITFLTEKLLSKEKDKRKILEEKLKIDGNNIYIRNEKIQIENLKYLKEKELLIENFHEEVAKDIVHDVFLTLWKNRNKLYSLYSLKTYLFNFAKNCALNYIKHQKVIENNERNIIELNENVTEELEYYEQCLSRLESKLSKLSEKQRHMLIAHFVDGETYKQIAEKFGISVNTAKTHVVRAINYLREELRDEMLFLFWLLAK